MVSSSRIKMISGARRPGPTSIVGAKAVDDDDAAQIDE